MRVILNKIKALTKRNKYYLYKRIFIMNTVRIGVLVFILCALAKNSITRTDGLDEIQNAAKKRLKSKILTRLNKAHFDAQLKAQKQTSTKVDQPSVVQVNETKKIVNRPTYREQVDARKDFPVAHETTNIQSQASNDDAILEKTINNTSQEQDISSNATNINQLRDAHYEAQKELSATSWKQTIQEKYKEWKEAGMTHASEVKDCIVGQVKAHPYAVAVGVATALAYETGLLSKIESLIKKAGVKHGVYVNTRAYLVAAVCFALGIAAVTMTDITEYTEPVLVYSASAATTIGLSRMVQYVYSKIAPKISKSTTPVSIKA